MLDDNKDRAPSRYYSLSAISATILSSPPRELGLALADAKILLKLFQYKSTILAGQAAEKKVHDEGGALEDRPKEIVGD